MKQGSNRDRARLRADRLRWQGDAARGAQRIFTRQPAFDLRFAGQHADRAHEGLVGHFDAGHLIGFSVGAGQPPVDQVGLGIQIAQKTETGNDDGIAVFVRDDIDQRDRDDVAAFRALDMDRPSHRMHEIEIDGGHVVGI